MEIRRYIDMILRWWWLLAVGALLLGGVVFIANQRAIPIYQAKATLLVDEAQQGTTDYTSVILSERLAATYAQWLTTRPVLEEVIAQLQLPMTVDQLARAVTVSPVRNTQLIVLSAEDAGPAQAAAIANTIPEVFREQSQTLQAERFVAAKASVETQLNQVQNQRAQLQEASDRADRAGNTAEYLRLQSSLREVETFEMSLTNSLAQVRLEEAKSVQGLFTIEPAQVPSYPVRPRTLRNTLMAALVGLLGALGLILALEYLNDVVRSPDEVSADLGLATVGLVPDVATTGNEVIVMTHSNSAAAESYRVLRTNLQFASVDHPLRTLLITSPSAGEGKTRTSANLAAALAQAGKRVILVDTDLRRPRVHHVFGAHNNVGLTSAMLDSTEDWRNFLLETPLPGLLVLTSGPVPPNPAELVGSARMAKILEEMNAEADYVILDSAPILAVSDTAMLTAQADGVLLVLRMGASRRDAAMQAAETLQRVGARVIGVVLNRVPTHAGGYYYGNYSQYYGESDEDVTPTGGFTGLRRKLGAALRREPAPAPTPAASTVEHTSDGA